MAITRRRYITPEVWSKEDLLALPPEVRLTEIGLRMYADDEGRERVNPMLMRATLFPLNPSMTEQKLEEHILRLDQVGCLVVYDVRGQTYYAMKEWPSVDRPRPSAFPEPPKPLANDSRSRRDPFVAVEREGEGEREESEGEWVSERGAARSDRESPPSPFCRNHPQGTDNPCRACGTARLRYRMWEHEHLGVGGLSQLDGDE